MAKMLDIYNNLEQYLKEDILLDVRTEAEFKVAHIEGAINLSHDLIQKTNLDYLKNKHLHVYCRTGGRVQLANEYLKKAGITNFTPYFEDGMLSWIESGYPTVTTS